VAARLREAVAGLPQEGEGLFQFLEAPHAPLNQFRGLPSKASLNLQ